MEKGGQGFTGVIEGPGGLNGAGMTRTPRIRADFV
jgi:hypothetical protein